jgi:hypothetical protein
MISKSRVSGGWVLDVLENFQSDRTLPKFRKAREAEEARRGEEHSKSPGGWLSFPNQSEDSDAVFINSGTIATPNWSVESKEPRSVRRSLLKAVERILFPLRKSQSRPAGFLYGNGDPIKFFAFVRKSLSEAECYANRIRLYDAAIAKAKEASQMARVAKLMRARQLMEQESILAAAGFKQLLTEASVIEFASKCKKGLRLDWVANFSRQIPDAVIARKTEADTLKVFDNYVVLHYDPKGKAFELTPQEVAARRDPILFGVIDGARKLYFIGDWKDSECDLTMEDIAKVLGHAPSEINPDPTVEP